MSTITQEMIGQLGAIQAAIWEQTATAATEQLGKTMSLTDPLTVAARTQDIVSDLSGPMLVLKFALTSSPNNFQLILIPADLGKDLAGIVKGEEVGDLGEDVLTDIKPFCQAIADGLCQGISQVQGKENSTVAFTVVRQILELPETMEECEELVRVQVGLSALELSGSITWLLDETVARDILGVAASETFNQLEDSLPVPHFSHKGGELELLLDIPLLISVELGRAKMLVQDVVELNTGSVVEIDKAAGDPVDVLVNGKLVARGEVVVIEDNFGVRITEILSPQERVAQLGDAA